MAPPSGYVDGGLTVIEPQGVTVGRIVDALEGNKVRRDLECRTPSERDSSGEGNESTGDVVELTPYQDPESTLLELCDNVRLHRLHLVNMVPQRRGLEQISQWHSDILTNGMIRKGLSQNAFRRGVAYEG